MQTLYNLFGRQAASWMRTALLGVTAASQAPSSPRDWYDVLKIYYESNALYQVLRDASVSAGLTGEAMRSIKNPCFRAVEFHAAMLWPGSLPDALPIETENEAIIDPIGQIWQWSNWGARKQVVARNLPLYGDWFCKVRSDALAGRVWFQNIEPRYVTDFEKDDRGFITFIRLDVQQITTDSAGNVTGRSSHVEAWSKALGTYRSWHYPGDATSLPLEQLGAPELDVPLTAFGVDFIPIVHAPFRDVGDTRGVGCFVPVLDKIDEVNRIATRLHQMGFRNMRNIWASLRTGTDGSNRPLPPASVGGAMTAINAIRGGTMYESNGQVRATSDETFIDLPGSTDLKSLVPQLAYGDLLAVVQEAMAELESDLPEIRWYRLSEQGADLSGRAIRLLMAPASKRVQEARGNAETALVRLDQMGLTIGDALGLWNVGSFEGGDFEHAFAERDVFPITDIDEAEAHRARAQAVQSYTAAGVPLATVLLDVMNKTEEEATKILRLAEQDANRAMQSAMESDPRDNEDVQAAERWLEQAIARHERHMNGTEPTTGAAGERSQQTMMDEMQNALDALTGESGMKGM